MSSENSWIKGGAMAFAAAGLISAPMIASAQEEVAAQPREVTYAPGGEEEIAPINDGNWTFELTLDVVSSYWFRGISQGDGNDDGFIPQLGAAAEVLLADEDTIGVDDVSISFFMATWNSFTTSSEAASGWYESDLVTGFSFGLPQNFSASISYVLLHGVTGGEFAQEIDIELAFDDTELMDQADVPFSLQPYVLFAFETSGSSDGAGNGTGGYFEAGINPSVVVFDSEDYPITLSVPVTIGLSLYDYYEFGTGSDDTFGYADIGLIFGVPLTMIPVEYGNWELSAGAHVLILGDNARAFSAASGTGSSSVKLIGVVGLAMTY